MEEKTIQRAKIITVSGIVLFFILVIALLANIISVGTLRARRNSLQKEYDRLLTQNSEMQGEIEYKNTDAYLEQYAREVLDMIKEGETILKPR